MLASNEGLHDEFGRRGGGSEEPLEQLGPRYLPTGAGGQGEGNYSSGTKGEATAETTQPSDAPTGGRLGNEATRAHVDKVGTEMEKRGWTITHGGGRAPEEYLPGPGGARKGSSYPDITATKDDKTLRVNTIDTRANGITPTTREATNADRIRTQTGEHVLLVPKPQE